MAAFGIKAIQPQDNEHIFGFTTARGTADMALLEVWNGPTQSDLRFTVDKEGQLQTRDGSAARPTYSFESDKDTGRYLSGAASMLDVVSGTAVGTWTAGKLALADELEVGDNVTLKSDAAVLNFGADSDVSLTHVADTGLLLNSTMALQFYDSSQYINAPSDAILDITAADEIELNATLVDVNANLEVSGTSTLSGVVTFGATPVFGSDLTVGDDLYMDSDGAVIHLGDDGDVTLTHVHDTGLLLNSTMRLQFNDASQYISGTSATVLSIAATDEIDLTATAIDLNGTLDVSGTSTLGGVLRVNNRTDLYASTGPTLAAQLGGGSDIGLSVANANADFNIKCAGEFAVSIDGSSTAMFNLDGTTTTMVGDVLVSDDLTLNSDAAVLGFGTDTDVTLIHVADTALLLNSTRRIQFNDSSQYIGASSAADLDLGATTDINLDCTTVDVNAAINVSGNATLSADATVGDDLTLLSDAAILGFGLNTDVTLTHVHDTGLLLNSTMQLQFNDSSQYIAGTSGTVLSIVGDAEIDLTATAIDINGTVNISGATVLATSLTLASGATVTGIDNGSLGSSATLLATQGAVKTYVDAQVTALDLDITTDSGTIDITDGETLTIAGGTGLASSASSTTVTLAIDSTVATLTGSQTLTNKSLTTPILTGSASAAGSILFKEDTDNGTNAVTLIGPASTADVTVTLPAATDTLVGKATADTLTNKSLTAPVLTGSASAAGSILFKEDTDNGTNAVTLIGPAATADVTLTLPASTDTLLGRATTDTLTNKTLTSPDINAGTVDGITSLTVGTNGSGADVYFYSATAGDHLFWDSSEELLTITGTAGQTALSVAAGNVVMADDVSVGDDLTLGSDSAVLNFGADSDVSLSHVHDTALLLNSTRRIQFNDASQYIGASSAADLDLGATTDINMTCTTVDINGAIDVSGVSTLTGNVTMSADASVGDDLTLVSDGAILNFGVNSDVSLTHVHDTGLLLNSTMQLQFNDASQYISGASATKMVIAATDEVEINATAVDLNGTLDVSGTLTLAGNADFNGDLDVDGTSNLDVVDIDGAVDMASTLAVTGNVGIGGTHTASELLHVKEGSGTTPTPDGPTMAIFQRNTSTGYDCGVALVCGTAGTAALTFGDSDDDNRGGVLYAQSSDTMSLRVGAGTQATLTSSAFTVTPNLVVSGTGPHAIGGAVGATRRLSLLGAFTGDGSGTSTVGLYIGNALTGASGDTGHITGTRFQCSTITQTATENIAVISQVRIEEPAITDNLTGDITLASTAYIASAPTEGESNWALYSGGKAAVVGQLLVSMDGGAIDDNGFYAVRIRSQFGSDGSSNRACGVFMDGTITGAVGDTSSLASLDIAGSITTQGTDTNIGVIASIYVDEPTITNNLASSGKPDVASTVYIKAAPTEGDVNAALYVAAGAVFLNLPTSAGVTGSLWANSGVVTVA